MFTMQVFLRWEIDLYVNYLGGDIFAFRDIFDSLNTFTEGRHALTVNEFRAGVARVMPKLNIGPHPDDRGEAYIFANDQPKDGDDKIPDEAFHKARMNVIKDDRDNNGGKLGEEKLRLAFPKLFSKSDELGFEQWYDPNK